MSNREYYDAVCEELVALGWDKQPDWDTVMDDMNNDKSPEDSAQEFADDWED